MSRVATYKYAEVLLPQKFIEGKDTLTYEINPSSEFSRGMLVEVPLRNRKVKGVITSLHNQKPSFKTREITNIVENAPHLQDWQIDLMEYISDYYFCPLYKVLKLFLPTNIIKNKKITPLIIDIDEPNSGFNKHELTNDQELVIKNFIQSQKQVALLLGITGSGKTEIYLRLAEKQIALGKQVLILVPEISLTPQTLQRFESRFPNQTALIHSQLTARDKKNQWLKIYQEKAKIIIGSRSALFAPYRNLGLIVIDEEHEPSFKQDQSPRYNTIDIAKKMASFLKIKVLLGSATPSLESYYLAEQGEYELLELPNRIQFNRGTKLPFTTVIDLREEIRKQNFSIFSELLLKKIEEKLNQKEQIILFINRRGAASAVVCRECGYIVQCPNCEVAMTYHKKLAVEEGIYNADRLICHHCGRIEKVPVTCPHCQSVYIKYIGLGTQKVEDEITKLFPLARIIRADSDTVQKKDDFKNIYNAFKNHQADILVGTQMIGKGLHLPKVNLVGVMLADLSLTIPDFRSYERTFQLITQVAGRAGREGTEGEVVVQTYLPDNYAIQMSALHDFKKFYAAEIENRRKMGYPPFNKLIKLTFKNQVAKACREQAKAIYDRLNQLKDPEQQITVTSYPALIGKLRGKFRWNVLIHGQDPHSLLKKVLPPQGIAIDVDPISIN